MNLNNFSWNDLLGNSFDLTLLKGKRVLVVNTASACGLTPQFAQLEELYQTFRDQDFCILGFPCNDFAGQDPGTDSEILEFCTTNYGVSFPMMQKVSILGNEPHPLFEAIQGELGSKVQWNFHKFLFDEQGNFLRDLSPQTLPVSEEVLNWLNQVK